MKRPVWTITLMAAFVLAACGADDVGLVDASRDSGGRATAHYESAEPEMHVADETAAAAGSLDTANSAAAETVVSGESGFTAIVTSLVELGDLLDALEADVAAMLDLGALDDDTRVHLLELTELIRSSLREADLSDLVTASRSLRNEVERLVDEGAVDADTAALLIGLMDEIEAGVDELDAAIDAKWSWPDFSPDCEWYEPPEAVMLWVDASSSGGGDGSQTTPFATIEEALAAADGLDAEAVRLHLAAGVYAEEINVTRDTDLISTTAATIAGSIVSDEAHRLLVDGVRILHGSLVVAHPCAATRVRGVVFEEPPGTAIMQEGGFMSAVHTQVVGHGSGAAGRPALELRDGAAAELGAVSVESTARGLRMSGAGTVVVSYRLHVASLDDPAGPAIEVGSGARFLAGATRVESVFASGMIARDDSVVTAVSFAVDGVVDGTDSTGASIEALAVVADDVSHVEITWFDIANSEVVGVVLRGELAEFYLHEGVVHHNQIGAWLAVPDTLPLDDLLVLRDRLVDDVIYRDNGVNYLGPLILPTPPSP